MLIVGYGIGVNNRKYNIIKKIKISWFEFAPIIGVGFWSNVYTLEKTGLTGCVYSLILPFMRWQWGYLIKNDK